MTKNKEYYIDCYETLVEQDKQEFIREYGKEEEKYYSAESVEQFMNAEQIVGYYLVWHEENALNQWLSNLKIAYQEWNTDKEVTRILNNIFNKEQIV